MTYTPVNTAADAVASVLSSVVSHDTAPVVSESRKSNISAYRALEELVTDKASWEANAFRASNDQLYALLQRCYKLYTTMCEEAATAKQLIKDVESFLLDQNCKVSNSMHTLTKIIKCVFGTDRRRVSAYSIALRAALAAKITAEEIPDFIREHGGVEELRLGKSPNAKTIKQKALVAAETVDQVILARVKIESLSEKLDAAKVGAQHVLIVTQAADGAFDVNAFVSSSSAVNAALAAWYGQTSTEAKKSSEKNKQARGDDALSECINQALQTVLDG